MYNENTKYNKQNGGQKQKHWDKINSIQGSLRAIKSIIKEKGKYHNSFVIKQG